jgi:hypothetical protein
MKFKKNTLLRKNMFVMLYGVIKKGGYFEVLSVIIYNKTI